MTDAAPSTAGPPPKARPALRLRSLRLPTTPLTSGEVLLRGLRGQDVPDIAQACQDSEIQQWTRVSSPYRESDARGWIAGMRALEKAGTALEMAIADRSTGRLVGAIGVTDLDWTHGVGEIGYWVAPASRNRGVATTALRLISRWALGPLGLERVEVRVRRGNDASCHVAEAAGFVREGVLRGSFSDKGRRWDLVAYGLISQDLRHERAQTRRDELGGGTVWVD